MNFNDVMAQALSRARDMQRQAGEAANDAAEAMKPHIEKSLADARDLQQTLSRHATETGELTAAQAQTALGQVNDFIRLGSEAMRESAEQTRQTALKMAEQSRRIVDTMQAAMKRPDDPSAS